MKEEIKICIMVLLLVSIVNIAQAQQSEFQGTWIEEDFTSMRLEISGNNWSYFYDNLIQGAGTVKFSAGKAELLLANGETYFYFTLLAPGLIESQFIASYEKFKYRFRLAQSSSNSQNNSGTQNSNSTLTAQDFFNSGNAYLDEGDYDRAITDYTQAIKLNNNFADAYYNRGNAYFYKDDYDRAIADYTQVIRLNPNDADAYDNRGNAYCKKGDYDRAIADCTQAIKLNPNSDLAYSNRGYAYGKKGDYNRAIADYTQAVKLNPNNSDAKQNIEILRRLRGW